MQKIDPDGVRADFKTQLDEQARFYDSTWRALTRDKQRTIAAEIYILMLGALFEGCINDLIFTNAIRNCTKVMEHFKEVSSNHCNQIERLRPPLTELADTRKNVAEMRAGTVARCE